MPESDQIRVRVRVHESQIARVEPGQEVTLQLDAFPTRRFRGKVAETSPTPEPPRWLAQDLVESGALVEIPSPPPGMKFAMTAAAEILTAEHADGSR